MEECAAVIDISTSPHSKSAKTCVNNKTNMDKEQDLELLELDQSTNHKNQLTEKNTSLSEAANYLIQFFYKTNQKYSCTRTKIGKLLSIAAMKCARLGIQLFAEEIFKYDGCGTTINGLNGIIDRDIYFEYEYLDKREIIQDTIQENSFIPSQYAEISRLDMDVKKLIEDVFVRFGSYSASDLGSCINPIVDCDKLTEANGRINLSEFSQLDNCIIELIIKNATNEVIDYILG